MSTQPKPVPIDRKVIAQGFEKQAKGKLPPQQIEEITRGIMADVASYPAHGSILGLFVYYRITVQVDGGKQAVGNAGGVGSVGGGALFGDVYTDDLNALYANSVSFAFEATPLYVSVQFFDSNGHLLGHFQSGAVSMVTGAGGGTISWS